MELVKIPFKMYHGSNLVCDDYWIIPQCTESEWNSLKQSFMNQAGVSSDSQSMALMDNLGPTSNYYWLKTYTEFFRCKIFFASAKESYPNPQTNLAARAIDSWFPMCSIRDNFYDTLSQITPDRVSGKYNEWNIDIVSGGTTYHTTISSTARGSSGASQYPNYTFFTNSTSGINYIGYGFAGCAVPELYGATSSGTMYIPVRIVDDNGTVVKLSVSNLVRGSYPFNTTANNVFLSPFNIDLTKSVQAFLAKAGNIFDPDDPYGDFPNTGPDAGETDPDPDDDDIVGEGLPTLSFADAGFSRIYRPNLAQLNALANYMWTDSSFLQTVINHAKQMLENPIDAVITLNLVPCVPSVGADVPLKIMYINTGVDMPPVTSQFVYVNCGDLPVAPMYGSALDYNPYTKVQLYLPYIGTVQLDTDEVMGKTLHLGYNIDVVTGLCVAYVKADADILYQFSGHCAVSQPITSADFSGYLNAAVAAGKLVGAVTASAAGAPVVAQTLVGAPTASVSGSSTSAKWTKRNNATGRQVTSKTMEQERVTENPGASFGEIATRGVSNTVGAVMNSKTIIQHTGGFSGNSGYIAEERRPYLIITRPNIANPRKYGEFNGRPCMMYLNLGSCQGYTQVQSVHLTGIAATNPEMSEIATLLQSGVLL